MSKSIALHPLRPRILLFILLTVCQHTAYAQFGYPGLGGFGGGFGGGLNGAGYGLGYGFGGYPTLTGPQQVPSFGGGYPCYGGYFCGGRYPGFGGYPFYGNGMSTAFASSSGGGIASASANSGYRGNFFG
ncbi:keratin-associated protein 19-2 [Eurosta solidaginis]|uniref:keratin-associated protein 19-2 n=1 Tax=Eurosta solidaginis TaxID=178769 RepID=UPI003530DE0B